MINQRNGPENLRHLLRECLGDVYPNYNMHESSLERQARDVLLCRFEGNLPRMYQEFLLPMANLFQRLHHYQHSQIQICDAVDCWPFTYHGRIVLHLNAPSLYDLTAGDVYITVDDHIDVVVKNGLSIYRLVLKNFDDLASPVVLFQLLRSEKLDIDKLIVESRDGTERLSWQRLLQMSKKTNSSLLLNRHHFLSTKRQQTCGHQLNLQFVSLFPNWLTLENINRTIPRQRIRQEDAMTQTNVMERMAASLPHIDSDISDDDSSLFMTNNMNSSSSHLHSNSTDSYSVPEAGISCVPDILETPAIMTMPIVDDFNRSKSGLSVESFSQRSLMCGLYLAAIRHEGKAVLLADLNVIQNNIIPVSEMVELFRYYYTVPRKSAIKNGVLLFMIGSPSCYIEAYQLIDQTLCHFKDNNKFVERVVIWNPGPSTDCRSLVSGHRIEVVYDMEQLQERFPAVCSLRCCGGSVEHSQEDWIVFRKIAEPFLKMCREQGKKLYDTITAIRKLSSTNGLNPSQARQILDQYEDIFSECLSSTALTKLQNEGAQLLHDISVAKAGLNDNTDARETLERCSAMYVEVQRTVNRLVRIWERRKLTLEKSLTPRNSLLRSRQILSWLCRKGEETLSRFVSNVADSLTAAKMQEREFQRFLALANKQIDKGQELLEDLRRDSSFCEEKNGPGHRSHSIMDLASSLQNQLSKFSHRLDDTRERLENTSRCYELLDKAYEWGVEAMKLASKLKLDQPCISVVTHLLDQVDEFLNSSNVMDQSSLQDLNNLAQKLDNPKLVDQCKLAQNRCQETMELLQFRRNTLADWLKENNDNNKRISQVKQSEYENIEQLTMKTEDKVDGNSKSYDFQCPDETDKKVGENCILLCVKNEEEKTDYAYKMDRVRGSLAYSSGTSLSSYGSSSSWSSRKKNIIHRQDSSGDHSTSENDSTNKDTNRKNEEFLASKNNPKEDSCKSSNSVGCQSPISVNSHLQCRASSIDLSLSIAEMQEAGLTENDIKSQKTLLLIMREMIQTERDYVRSLEYIIAHYIPELSREDIPQALRGKRNVIFGNIEKIYEFHHHYFLRELERCQHSPFLVGQCFLKHEQQFYLYALYNKNKPKSDGLMAEYGTVFFRRKQMELGDKMDLASYLLKPVQRMGKYALLLKQLLKESGDKEPEFADLMAAEQMVRFQLRHGNDLLAMDSLRDCDVNVKEQGRLLRQNEFYVWQGRKKGLRHVFLFEELILFSKSKRDPERKNLDIYIYKQSMKTSDIGFTAQVGESNTRFEIWFRKRKPNETFILEATNPEVKEAWVDDISRLLWKQALRNRELRMAEMAEMGIGNKPCLDIRPSQDQINDRSISYAQLAKAPRFRHSVCGSILSDSRSSKRPHSIISVSSSASSASSGSSSVNGNQSAHVPDASTTNPHSNIHHRSTTNQSQCSAESGILADLSMSYDDPDSSAHRRVGRSDSSITTLSADSVILSPSSPLNPPLCAYSGLSSPVSLYVNNTLIPLTPLTAHNKNIPMTEM